MTPLLANIDARPSAGATKLNGCVSPAGAKLFWGLLLAGSPLLWWLGNRLNGEAEPGEEPHRFMGLSLQKVPLIYLGLFGLYLLGKAMQ